MVRPAAPPAIGLGAVTEIQLRGREALEADPGTRAETQPSAMEPEGVICGVGDRMAAQSIAGSGRCGGGGFRGGGGRSNWRGAVSPMATCLHVSAEKVVVECWSGTGSRARSAAGAARTFALTTLVNSWSSTTSPSTEALARYSLTRPEEVKPARGHMPKSPLPKPRAPLPADGTWMRWSARSVVGACGFGAPSMTKVRCSTCSFRRAATPPPR